MLLVLGFWIASAFEVDVQSLDCESYYYHYSRRRVVLSRVCCEVDSGSGLC